MTTFVDEVLQSLVDEQTAVPCQISTHDDPCANQAEWVGRFRCETCRELSYSINICTPHKDTITGGGVVNHSISGIPAHPPGQWTTIYLEPLT